MEGKILFPPSKLKIISEKLQLFCYNFNYTAINRKNNKITYLKKHLFPHFVTMSEGGSKLVKTDAHHITV